MGSRWLAWTSSGRNDTRKPSHHHQRRPGDSDTLFGGQPHPPSSPKRDYSRLEPVSSRPGMGPRKKSKPNPKAPADASNPGLEGDQAAVEASPQLQTPTEGDALRNAPTESSSMAASATSDQNTAPSSSREGSLGKKVGRKWLSGGGSWRSKASASVKSSRESIGVGVAGGAPAEIPTDDAKTLDTPSPATFLSKRRSSKGNAIPAAMTKFNVSSNGSVNEEPKPEPEPEPEPEPPEPSDVTPKPASALDEPPLPPLPPNPSKENSTIASSTFGWRTWWSRPDGYSDPAKKQETEEAQSTPLPGPTPSEQVGEEPKQLGDNVLSQTQTKDQDNDTEMKDAPEPTAEDVDTEMKDAPVSTKDDATKSAPSASWFWLWSRSQNAQSNPQPHLASKEDPRPTGEEPPPENKVAGVEEGPTPDESVPATDATPCTSTAPSDSDAAPKPSAWAFWFTAKPKTEDTSTEGTAVKQVGKLAVSDTPSQSHPEAAQFNEQEQPKEETRDEPLKKATETSIAKRSFISLRGRPKTKQTTADPLKDNATDTPSSSRTATPSKTSPTHSPPRAAAQVPQSAPRNQIKKEDPPNLLFPQFESTYHMVQKPTYWQQIRQYFLGGERAMPHLHINPAPPRVKKAIAIGVHGFFPAPILQKVLGQPTGTSIRFATAAKKAIDDWTQARGYSADVEQIALEGEGFVSDRVNALWKLLLNWIDHIKAADFILVACHSQGVPVAIMLIAKLIQFGCVNSARIGVCAMAGVNLGPFIEYKTKYLGATAAELFEFSNPKSLVSQMYLGALDEVLRYGVRILYVGSIDDQLVSLESSTFSTISHPYIYRAVFVDGRIHAPDFLTHLVGFALKLRNLGLPDHGLIRELSPALAGSLYGGEGHSRLYDDARVYSLAVQHALETTSLPISSPHQRRPSTGTSFRGTNIPIPGAKPDEKDPYALHVKDYAAVGSGNQNPFFLPWAMRGLLEEEFVKKELGREVEELLGMFEEWKPQAKQLKDVKFRLEGVRSRL